MTRALFVQTMERLERETLDLGYMVAAESPQAVDATLQRDTRALEQIVAHDRRVNRERLAVEEQAIRLIVTQQPVATDVRLLASLLEIVGEIERLGDYAKGIACIGLRLQGAPIPPDLARSIVRMADRCETMMRGALDAFASRDPLAAQKIIGEDDAIDEAYRQLFASVLLMGGRDAAEMERSNYILWIAHDLERTADRCTNICERTIYLVTGALVADQKSAMEIRLTAMAEGVGDNPDRAATT